MDFNRKNFIKTLFLGGLGMSVVGRCTDLDQQPLTSLSQSTFWKSKSDAMLALTGIYNESHIGANNQGNDFLCMYSATDDSGYRNGGTDVVYNGYFNSNDNPVVQSVWQRAYTTIFRANTFLEKIDKVDLEAKEKNELIAEARFLRAYEYWYMSIIYGGVPLVKKTLTKKEANSVSRDSLQKVQTYCISELTEATKNLPVSRPADEKGRILKAASLAIKGRLLMIMEKWGQAANTYKEIIDEGYHIIDPRYKALFTVKGEDSKEIILSGNMIASKHGNRYSQLHFEPQFYGGYQEFSPMQNLVNTYLMKDGLPIEKSPLFDPDHPFQNRDPRLYATIFLPGYTKFEGRLYPKDVKKNAASKYGGTTGYACKKYPRENYTGETDSSGDDMIYLRYSEVLLSYLESKLENGDTITQALLNRTINKVRGRDAVGMPHVTETNVEKLIEIVRRERRVEFAYEHIIRYMDIRRWGIFEKVMNRVLYGMKVTDDPVNYSGNLSVATSGKYKGHKIVLDQRGTHPASDALVPIPQSEIDVNSNLKQNPGY